MTEVELNEILDLHKKWLCDDNEGKRADLKGADLQGADLRNADLRSADLQGADLRSADLQGANLDYSCWPLWCGSLGAKVCDRIVCQLLYHLLRLVKNSPAVSEDIKSVLLTSPIAAIANRFHRVEECGRIEIE